MWAVLKNSERKVLSGEKSLEAYASQPPAEFYVFGEWDMVGYKCEGPYPDYSKSFEDIYIVHHNMKWTMAHTHEIIFGLGPYFSFRPGLKP
jgi:hypothetical protein